MKNKYTIILTILSLLLSCIYIIATPYNNKTTNFSINTNNKSNYIPDNLYTQKNTYTQNNYSDINKINIDKNNSNEKNNPNIVNINKADKETLKTLPGIGDTLAQNIIYYRENISLFKDVSDIKNVDRIGDKIYEKIKNLITTG
ncbi:helix-hairpin-helix domain-containing protein [uncultured Tyzzerella sp.]|uniref:ComEA family DNA-binding protein n=1 Tax=uncultured Tyzzerella sp. TaxID=2321398 RepID=UPI002942A91C|nr:helix-hairpin-helix domain-containing protein [uncultured Tyzzerella sp.]